MNGNLEYSANEYKFYQTWEFDKKGPVEPPKGENWILIGFTANSDYAFYLWARKKESHPYRG